MKARLAFLAGAGVGYVLGARAGRQSYENIKEQANNLISDPKVQQGIKTAGQTIRENAPVVADKAKEAAVAGVEKAKDVAADVKDAVADKVEDAKLDEKAEDVKEAVADKAEDVKEAVADKAEEAKEKASDLKDAAAEKAEDVKEAVADKAEEAKDKAADLKDAAADKAEEVKEKVAEKKDDASTSESAPKAKHMGDHPEVTPATVAPMIHKHVDNEDLLNKEDSKADKVQEHIKEFKDAHAKIEAEKAEKQAD